MRGNGGKSYFSLYPYSICFCLLSPKLSGKVACMGTFANTLITGGGGRKRNRMEEKRNRGFKKFLFSSFTLTRI